MLNDYISSQQIKKEKAQFISAVSLFRIQDKTNKQQPTRRIATLRVGARFPLANRLLRSGSHRLCSDRFTAIPPEGVFSFLFFRLGMLPELSEARCVIRLPASASFVAGVQKPDNGKRGTIRSFPLGTA
ncbi:MAG TPA: hypothetical protein VN611_10290 [Patescibacteria group bacterium]|nr:hypothetical protein [Patescibacteria group bacterium]